MTVLDQLRAAADQAQRITALEQACIHARDLLLTEATGDELYTEVERVLQHLDTVIHTDPSKNPTVDEDTAADIQRDTNRVETRKPAGQKGTAKGTSKRTSKATAKAARRPVTPPTPAAGQATTKTCGECGQTKPRSEFKRHGRSKDGLQPYCTPCLTIRGKRGAAKRAENKAASSGTDAPATVTPLTPAGGPDDLVAVCPAHGEIAREPRGGRDDLLVRMWLSTKASDHRAGTRCDRGVELQAVA